MQCLTSFTSEPSDSIVTKLFEFEVVLLKFILNFVTSSVISLKLFIGLCRRYVKMQVITIRLTFLTQSFA